MRNTPLPPSPHFKMTERGPEVMGPADGPLEKQFVIVEKGPLYKGAEDRLPEIDAQAEQETPASESLLSEEAPALDRRSLLKVFGAGAALASAACVRRPLEKAIPYVNQPIDQAIGVPTYYATTCGECASACGITVKTVSGLPVKIEGNVENPISQGGTCAVGQAQLQGLFHPERRKSPVIKRGNRVDSQSWDDVYEILASEIKGKRVAIFTKGATGSQHGFYRDFLTRVTGGSADDLYTYDANPLFASIAAAHKLAFGTEMLPRVEFKAAHVVVGIGADFLDVGTSPVYHTKTFSAMHSMKEGAHSMGTLIQFESGLSLTGGRADFRHGITPHTEIAAAFGLLDALLKKGAPLSGNANSIAQKLFTQYPTLRANAAELCGVEAHVFAETAEKLVEAEGAVVLAGSTASDENSTALQLVTILINEIIGAYGKTLSVARGWMKSPVRPGDVKRFIENYKKYDVVFFIETNPVFSLPPSWEFAKLLKEIPTVVSMQSFPNEMDRFAVHTLNINHPLESWGDEEPVAGFFSPRQPAVRTTTDSRQAEDIFLWMAAHLKKPMGFSTYRDYLRNAWKNVHKLIEPSTQFELFFNAILRRGFVGKLSTQNAGSLLDFTSKISINTASLQKGLRLYSPQDYRLRDGSGASKPILQEIGEVMTSVAWDSFVAMNPYTVKDLKFKRNDVIKVESETGSFDAAIFPLPGVARDAIVVYRGNGHSDSGSIIADGVGVNPLQTIKKLIDPISGEPVYSGASVKLSSTGKIYQLAAMHKSHDLGNRTDIVKKLSLEEASAFNRKRSLDDVPDLYPAMDENVPYRWGMSIDLTKCTGCGTCMTACAVENNVPQVGREQVLKRREMHWIRLDRYFSNDDLDHPQVSVQPMLCQQCTHAPCEPVCPVIATSHDPEGINSMTYNRCIGTRYCANACPYKVRRFNWWTHKWGVVGKRPVDRNPRPLNPDVTVRTRGVMEKCNFCAQRVRHAKFDAKNRGSLIQDGEVKTACAQACPADAIVFGNLKDTNSQAAKARSTATAYLALGGDPDKNEFGIKTLPNVSYLMQISTASKKSSKEGHNAHE